MSRGYDVVVIGGGVNGLVTAGLLARRGRRVLLLERREAFGGAAVTEELHPGFRVPALAHATGPFDARVARALGLKLPASAAEPGHLVLAPGAPPLALHDDPARTAGGLGARDARRYPEFARALRRTSGVLGRLLTATPPDLDAPAARDVLALGRVGLAFRALGRDDGQRLLRWPPMPIADFAAEWFEAEPLRFAIAARALVGSFAGPLSPGTTLPFLVQAALAAGRPFATVQVPGGPGALSAMLAEAARRSGVELRASAAVERILAKDGRVSGVALASGEEIAAARVVSSADPKTTALELLDSAWLDPDDAWRLSNLRQQGMASKLLLALDGAPDFAGPSDPSLLAGRVLVDVGVLGIERAYDAAKHGGISARPLVELTVPSLLDPSLAPPGRHVISAYVHFTPRRLREGGWSARRAEVARVTLDLLEELSPGLRRRVIAERVIDPEQLERDYGLGGGHPGHAEGSLDQFFVGRPLIGWSRYRTPIEGLFLCGAGTHPGAGVTGLPGANAARAILRER